MQTKFEYVVTNDDHIFAVHNTRQESRKELKEIKALGYKDAKIIRQEFVLLAQKQVR